MSSAPIKRPLHGVKPASRGHLMHPQLEPQRGFGDSLVQAKGGGVTILSCSSSLCLLIRPAWGPFHSLWVQASPKVDLEEGRGVSALAEGSVMVWFPQGGPGPGHRGVHPLLRRLLCGHLRAGHRRPAQRQHHGPGERAGRSRESGQVGPSRTGRLPSGSLEASGLPLSVGPVALPPPSSST